MFYWISSIEQEKKMKTRPKISLLRMIVLAGLLSACNFPTANRPGGMPPSVSTAAAMTVEALSTQLSVKTLAFTPVATNNPTTAVATPLFTQTPLPPTLTPTSAVPCDRASFVSETVPDDSTFAKGAAFTKTWTLKNVGSCAWNSSYSLAFVKGDAMGAQPQQLTSAVVEPGQSIQVSVNLHAPLAKGSVRGDWMLRNASGVLFGVGSDGSETFWVKINVIELTNSFIDDMCAATWKNANGPLSCPGTIGDAKGFVIKVDNPKFENGANENEPALWMNPEAINDGLITGEFPALTISAGSHFKTFLACQVNATHCDVTYSVTYKADGGPETLLRQWHKSYDQTWIKVDEDLSPLVGKSVVFIFYVKSNGPSDQDQALWLLPRIVP
jgi:hypothetical protein